MIEFRFFWEGREREGGGGEKKTGKQSVPIHQEVPVIFCFFFPNFESSWNIHTALIQRYFLFFCFFLKREEKKEQDVTELELYNRTKQDKDSHHKREALCTDPELCLLFRFSSEKNKTKQKEKVHWKPVFASIWP